MHRVDIETQEGHDSPRSRGPDACVPVTTCRDRVLQVLSFGDDEGPVVPEALHRLLDETECGQDHQLHYAAIDSLVAADAACLYELSREGRTGLPSTAGRRRHGVQSLASTAHPCGCGRWRRWTRGPLTGATEWSRPLRARASREWVWRRRVKRSLTATPSSLPSPRSISSGSGRRLSARTGSRAWGARTGAALLVRRLLGGGRDGAVALSVPAHASRREGAARRRRVPPLRRWAVAKNPPLPISPSAGTDRDL